MNPSSTRAVQRFGVAVTALALGMGMSTPSFGAPAKDKATDCIDYGEVAAAPEDTIPRDDLHHVHKDPLAAAVKTATASRTSAKGKPGSPTAAAAFAPVTVPVRFHVIAKDRGQEGGDLSNARIAEQIRVLNEAYAPHGFSFELERITRTYEPEWFNLISSNGGTPRFYRGGGKEVAMKKALYGDSTSETLNIYSASLGQSLLGWAYFPSDFDAEATGGNPLPQYRDGVVVDYRSLPTVPNDTGDSRAYPTYGEGDTATHEVGHWLELYHTFQGGCSEPGDYVADTAPEASPAFQCPVGRDTCAGGGVDPITNFMDYTYDSCMTQFTAGQAARMQTAWTEYRAIG
ncbi:MAG TPA: zinc metalloprotease [Nocardioides sp.]|nr:zinc metalloprotease [Nocardioides sp.]